MAINTNLQSLQQQQQQLQQHGARAVALNGTIREALTKVAASQSLQGQQGQQLGGNHLSSGQRVNQSASIDRVTLTSAVAEIRSDPTASRIVAPHAKNGSQRARMIAQQVMRYADRAANNQQQVLQGGLSQANQSSQQVLNLLA